MKEIPDLIPLHDNRPGVRAMLQVEIRDPAISSLPSLPSVESPSAQRLDASQPSTLNSQPCLDFIASTATLDRYQEIIEPCGWRLDSYRRNPVFQNAHNYGDVLFTLGKALVTEVRSGPSTINNQQSTHLFQRIQFATEVNPVARIAYGLYRGGFLNAVSVGFIPLKWEDATGQEHTPGRALSPKAPSPCGFGEPALPAREAAQQLSTLNSQPSTPARRRYLEQELLEVSAVAIPANPDALALGVKSGAVAKADLKETLELLRVISDSLTFHPGRAGSPQPAGAVGRAGSPQPASGPSTINHQPSTRSQPSTLNSQLLQLARELRRVMRRA